MTCGRTIHLFDMRSACTVRTPDLVPTAREAETPRPGSGRAMSRSGHCPPRWWLPVAEKDAKGAFLGPWRLVSIERVRPTDPASRSAPWSARSPPPSTSTRTGAS